MAEWRDILDRAAGDLPINLDQEAQVPFRQQAAGWQAQQRGPRGGSFVASRDVLARELEAVSEPSPMQHRPQLSHLQTQARAVEAPGAAYRPSITQSIGQRPGHCRSQPRRCRKRRERCRSRLREKAARGANSRRFPSPSGSWSWRSTDFSRSCIKVRCIRECRKRYVGAGRVRLRLSLHNFSHRCAPCLQNHRSCLRGACLRRLSRRKQSALTTRFGCAIWFCRCASASGARSKFYSQRVRFTVELWAAGCEHRPGDLTSVISYDFIIDGIREILAEGHILLTETLAERIAAYCLSHRRAEKVRVVVEKLDRVPGASLGCEIMRLKAGCER